jgi:NitT/TauT family transport system substrate-binding protein
MSKIFRCFLIAVLVFLSGCARKNNEPYTIKVGASPVESSSGIFLAQEQGYFKELGLNVEISLFRSSGAPMTMLLSKGELDVGGGNLSSGLWNAINQGEDIRLVADKGHIEKGHSYIALMVRQDHIKSGRYKSFSDLKGFKMALTALDGVSQQIATEKFLLAGGLKLSDVEFLKMPYPEMNFCLENKSIDAAVQLEPYVAKAELDGIAKKVSGVYDVYPDQQSAAIFYSPGFIKGHPELARKFMIGYIKGVRDYENAFGKGINKKDVIERLKKYVGVESDEVWNNAVPVGLNPDGFINKEPLLNDIIWYKEHGYIEKLPDIDKIIDHSYVEKALKVLGMYKEDGK